MNQKDQHTARAFLAIRSDMQMALMQIVARQLYLVNRNTLALQGLLYKSRESSVLSLCPVSPDMHLQFNPRVFITP